MAITSRHHCEHGGLNDSHHRKAYDRNDRNHVLHGKKNTHFFVYKLFDSRYGVSVMPNRTLDVAADAGPDDDIVLAEMLDRLLTEDINAVLDEILKAPQQ